MDKETFERLKRIYDKLDEGGRVLMEKEFPELRESENEKMVRVIENVICTVEGKAIANKYGYELSDLADWLEKQKEPKHNNLPELKDKLCELFQQFRWYKDKTPTNGDILEYVDAHIQELLEILNEQKPAEWNMEDGNTRNKIIGSLDALKFYVEKNNEFDSERVESNLKELDNEIKWLENINPQHKQEWDEKDERWLKEAISIIIHYDSILKREGDVCYTANTVIDWLKSLKPNHWKPSKEEMEAFEWCVKQYRDCHFKPNHEIIESLYENLKKL